MNRLLAFVAAAALCACGAGPAASADGDARPVLVVQIDGLGPELLDDYLRRPTSRGPDRALHRVLGATPTGGGEVRLTRAQRATPPIPAPFDDDAVTAVVTDGGALLQGARHAGFADDPRDDAARVAALAGAKSGRVMMRLGGLAAALQRDGIDAGLGALGRVDALLAPVLNGWPVDAPIVIVGTHGAVPLPEVTSRPPQLFAEYLGLPVERLTATGGLLRVRGGGVEVAAKLDELDFTARVFVRVGDAVALYDPDLKQARGCDSERWTGTGLNDACAGERLLAWVAEGDVVAEARRSPAHDFQVGAAPAQVGVGGLSAGESRAVVVVVGRSKPFMSLAAVLGLVRGARGPAVGPGEGGLLLAPGAPDLEGRWLAEAPDDAAAAAATHRADAIVVADRVIVPGGLIADLGGPATFEAPLSTAPRSTVDAMARFGRGLRLFREGRFEAAAEALRVGAGLPAAAADWRRVMHAWADARRVGDGERAPFPDDLEGWPAVVSTFAQRLAGADDAPPLAEDASHPALRAAFVTLVGDGRSPCAVQTPAEREAARVEAAKSLEPLPGLAALIDLERVADDPRAAHLQRALAAARSTEAAWMRPVVARRVLLLTLTAPDFAARATAELDQAAETLLLSLQADLAADTAPGFEARRVSRLAGLVDGLAARRPDLLRETIAMAVGDARGVAPRVVGAIVAQGGIASLLSPNLPQKLTDMLRFADEALVEVRARPVAELTVDERVARVVAEALRAVLRGLEGNLPGAELALNEARELLRGADLLAARDAALAAVADDPDATPAPAAWGPYALLGVEATRAALALVTGRAGAARERVDAFLDYGAAFARHALANAGHLDALGGHVDALVAGLRGLSVALVEGDREGLKALGKLSLRLPEGPAADVGRWFVVAGVLARDAVWLVDTFGERPADDRLLTDATAAFDQLTATWPADSLVGQGALLVLKAAQRSVRDLPAVLARSDDLRAALAAAPHLLRALEQLHRDLRAAHPDAQLRARIRDEDAPELALLDRLIVLLEAGPATWVDPDAVVAVMEARNRLVVEALKARDGSVVRSLLAFERVNLLGAAGETDDALRWAKTGRAWSADVPAFAGHAYVWDLLAGRVARRAGKTAARDAAYAAAVEACPVLAAEVEMARGLDATKAADARAHFEAARRDEREDDARRGRRGHRGERRGRAAGARDADRAGHRIAAARPGAQQHRRGSPRRAVGAGAHGRSGGAGARVAHLAGVEGARGGRRGGGRRGAVAHGGAVARRGRRAAGRAVGRARRAADQAPCRTRRTAGRACAARAGLGADAGRAARSHAAGRAGGGAGAAAPRLADAAAGRRGRVRRPAPARAARGRARGAVGQLLQRAERPGEGAEAGGGPRAGAGGEPAHGAGGGRGGGSAGVARRADGRGPAGAGLGARVGRAPEAAARGDRGRRANDPRGGRGGDRGRLRVRDRAGRERAARAAADPHGRDRRGLRPGALPGGGAAARRGRGRRSGAADRGDRRRRVAADDPRPRVGPGLGSGLATSHRARRGSSRRVGLPSAAPGGPAGRRGGHGALRRPGGGRLRVDG